MRENFHRLTPVDRTGVEEVRVSASPVAGETHLLLDPRLGWQDAKRIQRALRLVGLVVVVDGQRDAPPRR